jgi:hypothetical protein
VRNTVPDASMVAVLVRNMKFRSLEPKYHRRTTGDDVITVVAVSFPYAGGKKLPVMITWWHKIVRCRLNKNQRLQARQVLTRRAES